MEPALLGATPVGSGLVGNGLLSSELLGAMRLFGSALLCTAVLGLPWALLRTRAQQGQLPPLQHLWPLALTLPALLLSLSHEAALLNSLGRLVPAQQIPTASGQALLLAYLGAAASLYYRPSRGTWIWAAVLCAVPMLLALQAIWTADEWSRAANRGEQLLPALLACSLSLGAWTGVLLAHRPALRGRQVVA